MSTTESTAGRGSPAVALRITPLYHGVALCRDLTLGHVHLWVDLGHAAYLCAWVGAGYALGRRTFSRRLVV